MVVLGLVFVAAICFGQPKGELVVCQGAEVSDADFARHHSITDMNYALQVFDMLYYRDGQGIPQPRLALSHNRNGN